MSQRQQLERILEIDRRIRNGEYPNAFQMAALFEVGRRVVFMDREFMINRLGAPIQLDRRRGGWFYSDPTWTLPNIMVTEGELLAFFLSVEVMRRYLGTTLESSLCSAVEKIARNMKGPVTIDLDTLRAHYSFSAPVLIAQDERTLLHLYQAIRDNRVLGMGYYTASRGEYTEREVQPYHLHSVRGDWYLIAFDQLRQDFRNFAVSRIEHLEVLSEHFERDMGFSISEHMGSAFQAERGGEVFQVVIRFDVQQARYIRERQWHATQVIEELPDGGLLLRLRTGGLGEVQRWVMQYGGHAEVLEPESLRIALAQEVEKMGMVYGGRKAANEFNQ